MPSVVIPCCNASATVAASVRSALAEPEAREVIAVDDGSTDATPAILAGLARAETRLKIIRQDNAGVAAARNVGIAAASGETLAFLDSDDLWHPGHLALNLQALAEAPSLGVSFSTARFIDASGRVTGRARPKLSGLGAADFLSGNPATTCSTLVVRRRVVDEAGGFDESLRRNEDQEWLLRVSVCTGWRIAGLEACLVDYRTSPAGLASDLDALAADFERVLAKARAYAPADVAAAEPAARARMHRWLARRALRLGLDRAHARRHIARAFAAAPSLAWREPRPTIGTAVASLLPHHPLLDRIVV